MISYAFYNLLMLAVTAQNLALDTVEQPNEQVTHFCLDLGEKGVECKPMNITDADRIYYK